MNGWTGQKKKKKITRPGRLITQKTQRWLNTGESQQGGQTDHHGGRGVGAGQNNEVDEREREVKGFYLLIISVNVELGFIVFSLETVGNVYAAFVF